MEWTDIRLTVAKADADNAEAVATMIAEGGIYIEDYSDIEQQVAEIAHVDLIEQELLDKPRDTVIIHMYLEPGASPVETLALIAARMEAAGIAYTVKREPIWSNNGYSMQFLFGTAGDAARPGWRPSVMRVQQEIERMQHPMVSVGKVDDQGDAYIATLDVLGAESTEMILKRLRLNTTMFRDIEVLDDTPTERRNLRHVRLRLTME